MTAWYRLVDLIFVMQERIYDICGDSEFDLALLQEPLLAYNLELSLVDVWFNANRIDASNLIPAMVGQDLRAHRNLLVQGIGWSVLPQFLCEKQLNSGELMLIPPPRMQVEIIYTYLVAERITAAKGCSCSKRTIRSSTKYFVT